MLTYVGDQTNNILDALLATGTTYVSSVEALSRLIENKNMAFFGFKALRQQVSKTLNKIPLAIKKPRGQIATFTWKMRKSGHNHS